MVYSVFRQHIYTCRAKIVSLAIYRTAGLNNVRAERRSIVLYTSIVYNRFGRWFTAVFTRCPVRTCEARCFVWAVSVRYKLACDGK